MMEALMGHKSFPPGIRFHPTDEELFLFYLKRKVLGKPLGPQMMSVVGVFQFDPWELPGKACLKNKDLNWYFICPRSRKSPNAGRCNRATGHGYWKSTGHDRTVNYQSRPVGKIKTLIFHRGKPPKGERTDWVMHEYRLEDRMLMEQGVAQDSYVICKIYEKSGLGPKNGEHYGAPFIEEEWDNDNDDKLETGRGLVLHPEGCSITHEAVAMTVTGSAEAGQLVPAKAAHCEQGSVRIGTVALDASMPSTKLQPEAPVGSPLPPVETEIDELDKLLAMLTDDDAHQVPETDIFKGLGNLADGNPQSEAKFDWSQFLSDDCFMEITDLDK